MRHTLIILAAMVLLVGCRAGGVNAQPTSQPSEPAASTSIAPSPTDGQSTAVFAGGCFWCMEGPFEALDGVSEVLSGYTGGPEVGPSYQDVAYGRTGHTEAVIVYYDPTEVTYGELVEVFWRSMDPTDTGGQFADRGSQYRPGIFVANDEERAIAEQSKANLEASGRFDAPIVVPVEDVEPFYVAEDYHQNYYRTNPGHYQRYRRGSGREGFLQQHWGDDSY